MISDNREPTRDTISHAVIVTRTTPSTRARRIAFSVKRGCELTVVQPGEIQLAPGTKMRQPHGSWKGGDVGHVSCTSSSEGEVPYWVGPVVPRRAPGVVLVRDMR